MLDVTTGPCGEALVTYDLIRQIAAEMAIGQPSRADHKFSMTVWGCTYASGQTVACAWGSAVLYATGRLAEEGPTEAWEMIDGWHKRVSKVFIKGHISTVNIGKLILIIDQSGKINAPGADFCDAFIDHVDLIRANLPGANFAQARMQGAQLYEANLTGANLRDCDLNGSDLRGACLTECDLRGAKLSSTTITGANLAGADVRGANFRSTDLRNAKMEYATYDSSTSFPAGFDPIQAGMKREHKELS